MSKLSDGIILAPIKGADLIKEQKDEAPKRYMVPSKRAEEEKIPKSLSLEQLSSESNFPSLAGAKAMTKSASWGQLRARLCTPSLSVPEEAPNATMKEVIDASLKKQEACEEEMQRNEATTDPFKMSEALLKKNGWARFPIKIKDRHEWFANSSYAKDPVVSVYDVFD